MVEIIAGLFVAYLAWCLVAGLSSGGGGGGGEGLNWTDWTKIDR